MERRTLIIGGGAAVVVVTLLILAFQRSQSQIRAVRDELQTARTGVSELASSNTALSNQVAAAKRADRIDAGKFNELVELRGEVTQLRKQIMELGAALEQSQLDLAVSSARFRSIEGANVDKNVTPPNSPIPSTALPPVAPTPPMLQAAYDQARLGQLAAMKAGLDEHPNHLNEPVGVRGSTLLHTASYNGHLDVAKELLGRGARVNQRNYVGETPLYSAVLRGTPEVIKLLLASGADPALGDNNGLTPLKLVVERDRTEIATILRQAGAK